MLDRLHEHVVSELNQGARTDTVFVVTAVAFNLVVLAINWNVADAPYNPGKCQELGFIDFSKTQKK